MFKIPNSVEKGRENIHQTIKSKLSWVVEMRVIFIFHFFFMLTFSNFSNEDIFTITIEKMYNTLKNCGSFISV